MTGARLSAIAALAVLIAAAPAEGAKRRPPRAGFWESAPLTAGGESASVLVRRSRRRAIVTAISTPAPPCVNLFGTFGTDEGGWRRLRVDRRGRFRGRAPGWTDEIRAVRGRFVGRRPRSAVLRAYWRARGCDASWRFRLRPVKRAPVREGFWTASLAGGSRLEFLVTNEGREVFPPELTPSPWFRCTDGSAYRLASFDAGLWRAWRSRDGSFELTTSDGNTRFSARGRLVGTAGTGWFRIVQTWDDGSGACDTGTIPFNTSYSRPHP